MATDNKSTRPSLSPTAVSPIPGQLWQVPTFVLGVLAILGVWLSRPLWYDSDVRSVQRSLSEARRTLENPAPPPNDLAALLTNVLVKIDRLPARRAEAHFLLGWAYARLAGPVTATHTTELWRQAREQLELAERFVVADADNSLLQYLLGKAWYQTGAEPQRIIAYLLSSIDAAADDRAEGYEMLTQAYLRLPQPDLAGALQANQKQLDQPAADENRLAPARLLRGELLLRLHDRQEARKVLARIGPNAPPGILSRARRLQARCNQEEGAWAEAAELWEAVLNDRANPPTEEASQILYALGCCYRNLHRVADAARVWELIVKVPREEGQAACLRLAESRLESGNRARALDLLETALAPVSKPEDYHNGLVTLMEARQILEAGCRSGEEANDYWNAQKLARLHTRLVSVEAGELLVARVTQAWAMFLRQQAGRQKTPEEVVRCQEEARAHFHRAAKSFEAAGEAAADKNKQLEYFWQAALDYREAQDFNSVVTVLDRYVSLGPAPEKLGEAWYWLGEAHQALEHAVAAMTNYKSCIGAPASPFAFRARYELAMIALQQGHAAEAEEMLRHNLDLMRREPDPEAHEKTLYAMADLLYRRGDFGLAAFHWEQALPQYPHNPGVFTARYRLATSYYRRAQAEVKNLPLYGDGSRYQKQQYHGWLEKAAANYQKLADDLETRRVQARLSADENAILAQALFGVANCRFDLGDYDRAIRLYDSLANRYQHQVEGLIAARRLFWCYLGNFDQDPQHYKAQASLERVQVLLNSLDDKAWVGRSDLVEGRPAWEKWLKENQEQLNKIRKMP
ncbi:MAG TPA: tetratricopeptide repeat protein [Gemmataceae bacterium]|jgi:tetratricopeptide (TPR) repeat protein|nr:tetratricopeptide repeat protein [Gemmataceae bacterium]